MWRLIQTSREILGRTWPSACVALVAWISIVISIDPAGSYPSMPQGPGLTVDEIFNVEQGVYLVEQSRALGWLNLIPGTSLEAFRPENGYNPDHPPLGRYWLGVHHHLTWWIAPPFQPDGLFVTACARTGSATAFALTVWLIGAFVTLTLRDPLRGGREPPGFGSGIGARGTPTPSAEPGGSRPPLRGVNCHGFDWAGPLASLALVLMPRAYGHAHLAALETVTNLTCTAAVLAVAAWWSGPALPTRRDAALAGIVLGCALLTKIQAILIPIPVIAWTLFRWRRRAIVPLVVWAAVSIVVFFAGWPYLWLDPMGHLLEYLGRTTNRVTLNCFYFGAVHADKLVPWHYPFVMFAVTVPLGLHLLGLVAMTPFSDRNFGRTGSGAETAPDTSQGRLLLACGLFPLIVFALPGIAAYDGERLFLTVFPLWAIFIGRGAARALERVSRRMGIRAAILGLCSAILIQVSSNLRVHPFYLSYYNCVVGGIPGAESLGLELNYWGDALTRNLLQQAITEQEQFSGVEIRPSLHQFQDGDLLRQSPILRQRQTTPPVPARPLRLAFRRRADLSDELFQRYGGRNEPGSQRYVAGFQLPTDPTAD